MSIFEATTAGVKTMADDTLRLTIDIEPRYAAEAFALFGVRGRAVAVTALKDGAGQQSSEPIAEKAPAGRVGPLAYSAVQFCKEPQFWLWADVADEYGAAELIRAVCEIESRRELDTNPTAAARFKAQIVQRYRAWVVEREAATC